MTPLNYKLRNCCFSCEFSDSWRDSVMQIRCKKYTETVQAYGICDSYTAKTTPPDYRNKDPQVCFNCARFVNTAGVVSCQRWSAATITCLGHCEDWKAR